MSIPYYPMYPTDFEADTSHLTLAEDGAYNRLLRLMWMTPGCSLPDDDKWIMRRMRASKKEYEAIIKPIICEFMKRKKGRVYSPRLRSEFENLNATFLKRQKAGKKGGRPKATENTQKKQKAGFDFDKGGPKQPDPDPEPEPISKERSKDRLSFCAENDSISEAFDCYNEMAKKAGLPVAMKLTKARNVSLKARLKDCGGVDGWRVACEKVAASPLCTGNNDKGWRASLDFMLRESSFAKIMEGNYDQKPTNNGSRQAANDRGMARKSLADEIEDRAARITAAQEAQRRASWKA